MSWDHTTVSLAAQLGGPDPERRTWSPHYEFSKLLGQYCAGPYSPEVDEFAIVLRFDGRFQEFGFEGLKYLRRSHKGRYITIDIGVPRTRWEGKSDREIREYLVANVRDALQACVTRLAKDKTPVNGDALMRDFERAAKEYLEPQ